MEVLLYHPSRTFPSNKEIFHGISRSRIRPNKNREPSHRTRCEYYSKLILTSIQRVNFNAMTFSSNLPESTHKSTEYKHRIHLRHAGYEVKETVHHHTDY